MDWTERINACVDYIEAHLQDDVDLQAIARLAGCSVYNLQRLFAYVADQPLSEYIRGRRLTQAAYDVLRTQLRLLDIAVLYGYASQDAFSRAFRQFHGVLPSVVRREPATLRTCPKLTFQKPTQEGMAMQYRVEEWPSFTVAGFLERMRTEEAFEKVPALWQSAFQDGRSQALFALFAQADYRPEGLLGVAQGGQWKAPESEVDYYLAVTTWVDVPDAPKVPTPDGMVEWTVPAGLWVIIEANGDPFEVMQPMYKQFYTQWLPASGYRLADLPVIESYQQNGRQSIWIGVEKA